MSGTLRSLLSERVSRGVSQRGWLSRHVLVPVTVALSLALIADIDSPKGGLIRVEPRDLTRLIQSLEP
ncbi:MULTISPECIES: hypothetical protein [unclassified Caballeronia]|uniref:hypothetical protein n=1 Tax=unclassified Caballeronia TaxID=2646786 RepID=UPI0020290137|nr:MULTISPECIES: hypothetical protein [unclassified Caballeronia]